MDTRKKSEHIVPAQPGWVVLSPSTDEKGHVELWEEPAIAWRIALEISEGDKEHDIAFADAITCQGLDEQMGDTALLRPDGRVVQPLVQDWNSKDDFLEFLRSEHAKKAA